MPERPLSGLLLVVAAVGLALAWSRGYLNGLTASLSGLVAGAQVTPRPFIPHPTVLGGGGSGDVSPV